MSKIFAHNPLIVSRESKISKIFSIVTITSHLSLITSHLSLHTSHFSKVLKVVDLDKVVEVHVRVSVLLEQFQYPALLFRAQ